MHQSLFKAWYMNTQDSMWWWVREDPQAWRLQNGIMSMRTLPGTLWGENNNAKNILVRPEITADAGLTCEVTVSNHPENQGEQAGLIWYHSDANYIKLVKESLENKIWVVLAREEANKPVLEAKIPILVKTARLRLSLDGEIVKAWAQPEGNDTWSLVGVCNLVDKNTVYLGVFTHGGTADADRWVTFRDFHIYKHS